MFCLTVTSDEPSSALSGYGASIRPQTTKSQAVARIADRTASQHLWGHVT